MSSKALKSSALTSQSESCVSQFSDEEAARLAARLYLAKDIAGGNFHRPRAADRPPMIAALVINHRRSPLTRSPKKDEFAPG